MNLLREKYAEELDAQIAAYAERNDVLGLAQVRRGAQVLYPTTVYQLEGDDTSGIAGMLMPDGTFHAVQPPAKTARYWEPDETLRYIKVEGELNELGTGPRIIADSWTEGEVVWDGSVAGSITTAGVVGEGPIQLVVNRRTYDASLGGEWATSGNLWKAMAAGCAMDSLGRKPGKVHVTFGEDDGGFAGSASRAA